MPKIVHFEIPADDLQRASAFYHDVLGWEISRFGDEPYWLVRAGEDGEPGANGARRAGRPASRPGPDRRGSGHRRRPPPD